MARLQVVIALALLLSIVSATSVRDFLRSADSFSAKELTQLKAYREMRQPFYEKFGVDFKASSIKCHECELLFGTVKDFLQMNSTETFLSNFAYDVCVNFQIETPDVCKGIMREFADEVIYIFTERFIQPTVICELLGVCKTNYLDVQNLVNFPREPLPNPNKKVSNNYNCSTINPANIRKFVHISDIHYDLRYKEGTNANCADPLCCREEYGPGTAGKWGDYNCDSPLIMLESAFKTIASFKPDFVVYTGDNSAHDVWAQTNDLQLFRSKFLYQFMYDQMPGIPVFPSVGNHESYPVDQFPDPANYQLMHEFANSWSLWLPNSTLDTIRTGGFYSVLIEPGLRVVSINTQYTDTNNFWLLLNWTDPTGQLVWLNQTLYSAEIASEKVFLIGHIPMTGGGVWGYADKYWQLVDRYSDTIMAQLWGHTHEDYFVVTKDYATGTQPINIGYVAPSITPYTNKNPSFRVVLYDTESKQIVNYFQYYLDLNKANQNGTAVWELEYNPLEAYQMECLSPAQWLDVVNVQFVKNNTMLQEFNNRVNSQAFPGTCDAGCAESWSCQLQSSSVPIYLQCMGQQANIWDRFLNHFCP